MKKNDILNMIGEKVQIARLKKGFTQEQLAEKCGVSTKYISAFERGKTSGSIFLIINICNILDISPNYIFNKTINNSNDSNDILPFDISLNYLKLKDENKKFVNDTIKHLYSMQIKR